jgi:hypothetical protein
VSHVWAHGELSLIHLNMKYPTVAEISDKWHVKYFCDNFCITFLLFPYFLVGLQCYIHSFLLCTLCMPSLCQFGDGMDTIYGGRKET